VSGNGSGLEPRRYERLDETVWEGRTPGGLPVKIVPKPGFQKKFAIVTAGYGAVDNAFVPAGEAQPRVVPEGIAHFLEHKLFEDEAGDVFDQFARHGASANAYTSPNETAYHFTTASQLEPCLDLLLDFVTRPYFTDESIEKERGVIAQEIRMYDDDPGSRGQLNLMKALYHAHPVREDVPGTVESIARIDKPLLELCHRTFYQPRNMVLSVAGDVDPEAILARVVANEARRVEARGPLVDAPIQRVAVDEPPGVRERSVEERMSVSIPRVLVGFKDTPGDPGPDLLRRNLRAYLLIELLFGRSSAFYERHYASGLIDPTFAHYYTASRGGYAYAIVGGETERPEELVDAVTAEIAAARRDGLDPDDFVRIRNKVVGYYLKGFNSVEQMAGREVDAHLEGWDLLGYLELLESITLDEVTALLPALLGEERRAVSLIRPLE